MPGARLLRVQWWEMANIQWQWLLSYWGRLPEREWATFFTYRNPLVYFVLFPLIKVFVKIWESLNISSLLRAFAHTTVSQFLIATSGLRFSQSLAFFTKSLQKKIKMHLGIKENETWLKCVIHFTYFIKLACQKLPVPAYIIQTCPDYYDIFLS